MEEINGQLFSQIGEPVLSLWKGERNRQTPKVYTMTSTVTWKLSQAKLRQFVKTSALR